jgi:hypothetical protein
MKAKLLILSLTLALNSIAQVGEEKTEYKKSYMASASEFILSMGNLGNVKIYGPNSIGSDQLLISDKASSPIPRFSAFFHFTQQMHYNFSSGFGMYTGLGMRNIGMINNLNDTIRVKHRAYGLSVPLAFKIGNMGKKSYFALGAEAEYMFHFKQKVFVGEGRGDKQNKTSEWFSNRVNGFNPSVFVEMNFGRGSYIRVKYYLMDFLNANARQGINVSGQDLSFTTDSSQLFAVSFGKVVSKKKKQ